MENFFFLFAVGISYSQHGPWSVATQEEVKGGQNHMHLSHAMGNVIYSSKNGSKIK